MLFAADHRTETLEEMERTFREVILFYGGSQRKPFQQLSLWGLVEMFILRAYRN